MFYSPTPSSSPRALCPFPISSVSLPPLQLLCTGAGTGVPSRTPGREPPSPCSPALSKPSALARSFGSYFPRSSVQVRPTAARAPPQVDARLCAEIDTATLEVTSRKRRIVEMEKEVAELRRQQEKL